MGVSLSSLIEGKEVNIDYFKGKIIAVDAMNMLYQFVTTIRGNDGTPLKDSKGNVTSHLTGLLSRISKLIIKDIKLVFVFDGEMPLLKKLERERREKLKSDAMILYEEAKDSGNILDMKKYASRTTRVTKEMIDEAKELISAFGIPVITAPSEGEAQASYMVFKGDCNFVASQDFDCLIYGAPKIVRNLSLSNKRKKINALTYKTVSPEVVSLKEILDNLKITRDQLIVLAMLIGTDFNIGGIKGLGPKKGLKLVKDYGTDFKSLFEEVNFEEESNVSWEEVFDTIKNMPTTDDYDLRWDKLNREKIIEILVTKHEFNLERVNNTINDMEIELSKPKQSSLSKFF